MCDRCPSEEVSCKLEPPLMYEFCKKCEKEYLHMLIQFVENPQ